MCHRFKYHRLPPPSPRLLPLPHCLLFLPLQVISLPPSPSFIYFYFFGRTVYGYSQKFTYAHLILGALNSLFEWFFLKVERLYKINCLKNKNWVKKISLLYFYFNSHRVKIIPAQTYTSVHLGGQGRGYLVVMTDCSCVSSLTQ